MDVPDYYTDLKFCPKCEKYVSYLMGMEHSYCVECGGRVRLFSEQDWVSFNDNLSRNKPKGGRPRKEREKNKDQRGRESA